MPQVLRSRKSESNQTRIHVVALQCVIGKEASGGAMNTLRGRGRCENQINAGAGEHCGLCRGDDSDLTKCVKIRSVRGRPGKYGSVTSKPFRLYWFSVHERPRAPKSSRVPVSRPPVSSLPVTVDVAWFSTNDQILRVVGSVCMETWSNRLCTRTSRPSTRMYETCLVPLGRSEWSTTLISSVRPASICKLEKCSSCDPERDSSSE